MALIRTAGWRKPWRCSKKEEALWLELGNRTSPADCFWNGRLLARKQRDQNTEREKLTAALDFFAELDMPRERHVNAAGIEQDDKMKGKLSHAGAREVWLCGL